MSEECYKFWSIDLDRHFLGEYSYAVIKGNSIMEDYSELVVGSESTFIGVYDGHGGHQTAEYLYENMFKNVIKCIKQHSFMDPEILQEAIAKTEDNWVHELEKKFGEELKAASVSGSSCLIGVIWSGDLFIVANVGDSRAVMGCQGKDSRLVFEPLTQDDNVEDLHSIGDAYLKYEQFNDKKENESPIVSPIKSLPSLKVKELEKGDGRFVILASHGFWKFIDSEEAAEIVSILPRRGIAAKLIEKALVTAAAKIKRSYEDVLNLKDNKGMKLHDDMTVVVVFFQKNLDQTKIPEQIHLKVGGSNSFAFEKLIHLKVN